jgi:hypothetical protein
MTEINICLTCNAPPALATSAPAAHCGSIAKIIEAPTAPDISASAGVPSARRCGSSITLGATGTGRR